MTTHIPDTMKAVLLTGHGGLDKLAIRDDVPVPNPGRLDVLIKVGAAGMNNTDINTRQGWYSKSVTGSTGDFHDDSDTTISDDTTWGGTKLTFPRIQGADIVGKIVKTGDGVPVDRLGDRVIVDPIVRDRKDPTNRNLARYIGSELDGGFAQYVAVPSENAYAVESDLDDAQLAVFPCSYSTAEHMLTRAGLAEKEHVIITGASGGVGSALVQLAKIRGAEVTAVTSRSKIDAIRKIGADTVVDRTSSGFKQIIRTCTPEGGFDVAADIIGGSVFPVLLDALKRGGRYVTSGAIAGPIVDLDLRTLYLKDLDLYGATIMDKSIFQHLVSYIITCQVRPILAGTYALDDIHKAQIDFMKKKHIGSLVLLPDF